MEIFGMSAAALVYVAFAFDALGFLARDELKLRLMMMAAMAFYICYYLLITEVPLWDAILTDGILAAVNLTMIAIVVFERTTWSMSADALELYAKFKPLSPGQFRRLLRTSKRRQMPQIQVVCRQGARVEQLIYLISGGATLTKDGESYPLGAGQYIGEIGFITGAAASGDVELHQGAEILVWDADALRQTLKRAPGLEVAMLAQFNLDLAHKVARGVPRPHDPQSGVFA